MNKVLSAILAGAAALALSGSALAADKNQSSDDTVKQNQAPNQGAQPGSDQGSMTADQKTPVPGQAVQPGADQGGTTADKSQDKNQPGADVSAKDQEYLAALKKCESLNGDQKQKCVDTAKKTAGEM